MRRHRLSIERLESRHLLSIGPELGSLAGSALDPYEAVATSEIGNELATTVLELSTGEFLTLAISPDELVGEVDLGGLAFGLEAESADEPFHVSGIVASGFYREGLVDLIGPGNLDVAFAQVGDLYSAVLMTGGTLDIQIQQSRFEWAEFVEVDVSMDVQVGDGILQLDGLLSSGKLNQQRDLDFQGDLTLREDFSFSTGAMSATLTTGGEVTADFQSGELVEIALDGIGVEVDIEVAPALETLKLKGSVEGKYDGGKIDFDGSLSLAEDFTYRQGQMTATLKSGGNVGLKVEQSQFKYAELTGLEVAADITIEGSVLKLEGAVSGKVHEDYKIDFDGSLTLQNDFAKDFGESVSVTLKSGGSLGLKVEQSQFKSAELTDFEATADITIEESVLKLEGAVSGKVHEDYAVDLLGGLSVKEDFTKQFGESMKATLKEGGSVGLKVERSEFQWVELTGVTIQATIDIDDKELSLEGSVSGKVHQDYKIDFFGSISVKEDFTKQFGDSASVTLKAGGALNIKVERSEFQWAELSDVGVIADVAIGQSVLKLAGSVDGKISEDDRIDFTGGLTVADDFEYERGALTLRIGQDEHVSLATRADGYLDVDLGGVALEADIALNVRKTLELAGIVTDGNIVDGRLDFDAELDLRSPLVLRSGPARVAIVSADVELSVDDGEIDRLRLRRPVVEVVPPGHPRRDDKSRIEDLLPDDAWNDLTAAVP